MRYRTENSGLRAAAYHIEIAPTHKGDVFVAISADLTDGPSAGMVLSNTHLTSQFVPSVSDALHLVQDLLENSVAELLAAYHHHEHEDDPI